MTDAPAAFDAHASEYDATRRRLVPQFDAFYGAAVRALELAAPGPVARVLDLGAGTGILSRELLARHPDARVVLVDGAPAMLARAEAALGARVEAAHVADLADPLPDGPFDAIVSSMAIHHLDAAGQALLYARAAEALRPGGVFVNAEIVLGPTPAVEAAFVAWHEADALARGSDDAEWTDALERQSHDRCSTAETGLEMLRAAGLDDVFCAWADYRFAVLVGRRPA